MKINKQFFVLALCILLALLGYHYARRQPILFLSAETDLSDAARYAFLTESDAAAALVVDMQQGMSIGRLALPGRAVLSSIDAESSALALADEDRLYVQQLDQGQRYQQPLPAAADALSAADRRLALRAGGHFLLYRLPELSLLSEMQLHSRNASLHYAALARQWLMLENPPALVLFNHENGHHEQFALPYRQVGPAALAPDNRFIAFHALDQEGRDLAVIWSLDNRAPLAQWPLAAPPLRPLIDNRSAVVYFADNVGQGWQFRAEQWQSPRAFTLPAGLSDMALGLLETRLIVRNADSLSIIDTDSLASIAQFFLPESGRGLFVSADSKTVLIGGLRQLFVLKLLRNQFSAIALPDAIRPQAIFMGAGNTLCH